MTGLAAEVHGLGVLVGLVTAQSSYEQEADTAGGKNSKDPAVPRPRQIDLEHQRDRAAQRPAFRTPLQQHPDGGKSDAENEEPRRDDVGENADVWVAVTSELIDRDKQEKGEECACAKHDPSPAEPVTKQALKASPRR